MSITTPHFTPAAEPRGLARLVGGGARGASRRPKLTIFLWLALVVGCLVAGGLSGTRQLSNAASGTGESAAAEARLHHVRATHPGVTVHEFGGGSGGHAITQAVDKGLQHAELISIPITLVILVLAFGALVAASVPLLLGLTSVAAAVGAGSLVSHLRITAASGQMSIVVAGAAASRPSWALAPTSLPRCAERTALSSSATNEQANPIRPSLLDCDGRAAPPPPLPSPSGLLSNPAVDQLPGDRERPADRRDRVDLLRREPPGVANL